MAAGLAFAGGALLAVAAWELVRAGAPVVRTGGWHLVRRIAELVEAVGRVEREGREPGRAERRRLLAAGAAIALCAGTAVAGPLVGVGLATAGPWLAARGLRAVRRRYVRAVDDGAAAVATALADGLSAGCSLRGAIALAARGVDGQAGSELRRTAAELEAGASTEEGLEALSARTGSPRIATVVAACLVQAGAGGDLAGLLRECAASFGDQARLEDEVRAATAQARFTGLIVVALPIGGALLAELASPGFVRGLTGSLATVWLVFLAVLLQVVAAVLIRRFGRVEL